MTTASERITVLVTTMEKKRIVKLAKDAGLSTGEFMRRAAFACFTPAEEAVLEGMIEQMNKSTGQANAAIDDALAFIAASNQRIAAMERNALNDRPDPEETVEM